MFLYAEDHDELRESTIEILKNFFSIVDSASNGEEALKLYKDKKNTSGNYYDIVLTDIQMPTVDGITLTKDIYEINSSQVIIVLSAHDDSMYLLPLINIGIEYFIKKPIDYQELLNVLLNTSKKINEIKFFSDDEKITKVKLSKNLIYDREKKLLYKDDENIYLTKYEIIFIQLLTEEPGKIYSNEEIVLNYALKDENIDAQNIRKLVSKLRKKLPEKSLESIYGIGYRFVPYMK
jgi:DNA-binding response OmpR family regulator